MTRGRKILFTTILLGFSLLLAGVIAEIAIRVIAPQPTGITHQDRYGLALHYPGITRYLPLYGHEVSFNSAGMRDREHPIAKPAGTFRILVTGDSFMEALQVPFEASLPSLLETGLQAKSARKIEVINAGVSGWGTDDALRYLTEYGFKYQPDLVLVTMTLHNDISDNLRQDWHRLEGDSLVTLSPTPMSWWQYKKTQVKAWLSTRFQLYQLWRRVRHGREIRQGGRQLASHVVQLFTTPTPERIGKGVELTDLLLHEVKARAEASGAKMAVVFLPLKYQLSDSVWTDFVTTSQVPADSLDITRPQSLLAPAVDSLGVPLVDLLPAFRAWSADSTGELYMEWDGHWNENGHRLATNTVIDGLLRAGAVPTQ
jgi:hypothetical protein